MRAMKPPRQRESAALRQARKGWRIQYVDSAGSIELAEQSLARAEPGGDTAAEAWARLTRGFHRMRYVSPREGAAELRRAQQCFARLRDRRGEILATVGVARCEWMEGSFRESLDELLPLRAEALAVLRHEERAMFLNGIAGCYSAMAQSAQAFAYMYEALRESGAVRDHGFDVVLYCNLAHELYQLGDYYEALSYLKEGIARGDRLHNARLASVLRTNRVVCLTDLERAREALADIEAVLALPGEAGRRGPSGPAYETMAIAALRAGELVLGQELLQRAREGLPHERLPDARVELVVGEAELLARQGDPLRAVECLEAALPLQTEGLSLRAQCLYFQMLADLHERLGHTPEALRHMHTWQQLHTERARLASQARYQAASLQTELLRLQHERDEIDARQRATERAKAELEAINLQLQQKVREVEALQAELQQRAVRDALTGLFNRRHLNDVLPSMLALAQRDGQPLAMVIIDLDHFKAVNDEFGHQAGDLVLQAFGELLRRRMRKSDVACRYGGEEFCLLLPRTGAVAARRKVEGLLKEWRGASFDLPNGRLASATFSAGVADTAAVAASPEALLNAADRSALQAKRLGRNRVVVADVS
jgi:diguanylate cyclase (GGDEF)-like protein